MTTSTLKERLGAELGERFTVEREIARGGMAVVYLARDRKHERQVAVKLLDPMLGIGVLAERFHREIALLARLQHPHILPLLDSGAAAGSLYYVMPFVPGLSLRQRIDREGPLPVRDALRIAEQVADALAHAHAEGIVHRDVKPENVLLPGYHGREDQSVSGWHAVVCDFGIARLTGRDTLAGAPTGDTTREHFVIGTPSYMPPEQASGARDVDARADIYALGVVLHEMLTGALPASTATFARARRTWPRRLGRRLEALLARMLAPDPARRFASATALKAALEACAAHVPSPHAGASWTRRAAAGAAVAAVATATWLGARAWLGRGGATLDDGTYVVLPFAHADGAAPQLVSGDQSELQLADALARWRGVRVVPPERVSDARLRRGATQLALDDAVAIARSLGAGRLAWGDVRGMGDSVYVAATLYRVRSRGAPVEIRRHHVSVARDLRDVGAKFAVLADSLLVGSGATRLGTAGAVGTRSLPAWEAYDRGHRALAVWDLAAARREFRAAAQLDPDYPQAQFWLAQTSAWSGDAADEARDAAAHAAALADRLPKREAAIASALAALGDGRFDAACARYRGVLATDSTDFAAWYGLGECLARDSIVVRAPSSPTGYAFRGSYHTALEAYARAMRLVPAVQLAFRGAAFSRLENLLYTRSSRIRRGRLAGDERPWGAFPSIVHDTLAFAAAPMAVLTRQAPPASTPAALFRNRERLRDIASAWVQALPRSAVAHETLAHALEITGQLTSSSGPSALSALHEARRLTTDPVQRLRVGAAEVQVRLKLGDFAGARRLADSLRALPMPAATAAKQAAAVALLTGHVLDAAALLRRTAVQDTFLGPGLVKVTAPPSLAEAALALQAFASAGAPRDSILALVGEVDDGVERWVAPAERMITRQALLAIPLRLAYPAIGLGPVAAPGDGVSLHRRMQRAAAAHDTASVRRELAALDSMRMGREQPGDIALDGAFLEAALLAEIGDQARAIAKLDASLLSLATLSVPILPNPIESAALPRAMALRAELAAAVGDRATAARWARAVVALWSDADASLAAIVARQRALASPTPP